MENFAIKEQIRCRSPRTNTATDVFCISGILVVFGIGNGEDEDRRMFSTLRCCLILDSGASPPVPSSLLSVVLEDEGEVSSSSSSEPGINRKGDTPPGLITRKFSCHSPRLILGF